HLLPVRLDWSGPLLRPLRVPDRSAAPARAAAHRLGEGAALPAAPRAADLAALLRLGRVPRARPGEMARHLAGSDLPLQLLPGAGERRLVALHRGAVLSDRPAAPARGPAAVRAEGTGLGAAGTARADAGRARGVARRGGRGRARPHLRSDPHPL